MLREGGVVLATVPAVMPVFRYDDELWGDYWRFTAKSLGRLFEESFGPENVTVHCFGNILAVEAFLHNLPANSLTRDELDAHDQSVPLVIAVRAVRAHADGSVG